MLLLHPLYDSILSAAIATPTLLRAPRPTPTFAEGTLFCADKATGDIHNFASKPNRDGLFFHTDIDETELLKVQIDLSAARNEPVNMESLSAYYGLGLFKDKHTFVGAISGSTNATNLNIGPTGGWAALGPTQPTKPHAPPTNVSNLAADINGWSHFAESAIWRYDNETRQLTPRWVNMDGSTPDIYVFYCPDLNDYVISGTSSHEKCRECNLTFIPI